MIQRVTLPTLTYDILTQFGDINVIVNKILDLVEKNVISIHNLPSANTTHVKCKKITLIITNQSYIDMYDRGERFSLTRLLQYFVDNELYNEFYWEISDKSTKNVKLDIVLNLLHIKSTLIKLCTNIEYYNKIYPLLEQVTKVTEEIDDECILQN